MRHLYFDYNATTPVLQPVLSAMLPHFAERFGNPGCAHIHGLEAKQAVDRARAQVAALINAPAETVIFTSCATESNNMVLKGLLGHDAGARLVISAIEHPSILAPAARLTRQGVEVVRLPVDHAGLVDPIEVKRSITPSTRLVSIMLANNETGVIEPLAEIASVCRARGVLLHTDASQAVGKIPVDVEELGVDLMTLAGHKLYAPKGIGALYLRPTVDPSRLAPLLDGGGQEGALRSGTENVPYMVAMGEACRLAASDQSTEAARQESLGRLILQGLDRLGLDYRVHGHQAPRLPNTLSLGFADFNSGDLLSMLVEMDVSASGGAACHAGVVSMSHVLHAMEVDERYGHGTIRLSWGRPTTEEDVSELLRRLESGLHTLPRRS